MTTTTTNPTADYAALLEEITHLKARVAAQEERTAIAAPVVMDEEEDAGAINAMGERVRDPALRWDRRAMLRGALLAAAGTAVLGTGLTQVAAQATPPPVVMPETPHGGTGSGRPLNAPAPRIAPNLAGSEVQQTLTYAGTAFQATSSTNAYNYYSAGSIYRTAGTYSFDCSLSDLPVGAVITGMYFVFIKGGTANSTLELDYGYPYSGSINTLMSTSTSGVAASTGVQYVFVAPTTPLTVIAYDEYYLRWYPGSNDSTSVLYGVSVLYTYPNNAYGKTTLTSGIGVYGEVSGNGSTGVQGVVLAGSASGTVAINAQNRSTAAFSHALTAVATAGHGLVGSSLGNNTYAGLVGNAGPNGARAGAFYGDVVFSANFNVLGNQTVYGTKSAAVPHADGSHRLVYCVEAPDSLFEDHGKGKLVGGKAEVKLDLDFAAVVKTNDYLVFLTPYGDSKGLYVTNQTAQGFSVREQQGGTASLDFAYRIVVKRSDVAAGRLAKVEKPVLAPLGLPDEKPPKK